MYNNLMTINNLKVNFDTYAGTVHSVRGVNFDIKYGETLALVGESGCGKSVTARSLMGLQAPGEISEDSEIIYKGENIKNYTEDQWNNFRGKEISMIFQDAMVSLNPTIKIGRQIAENLINHFDMAKDEVIKRCVDILNIVGISDANKSLDKYPHELSGGMRQRVMIAIAMVTNPSILIADEPTTALDVTIQAQILEEMTKLQKEMNMSILLITHDMGVVADIADRVEVMYAGQIVESGSAEEIFYETKHPYTWALLKSVPRLDLKNNKKLLAIEGSLPDAINPPKGCGFYSRCPYAMGICRYKEPKIIHLSDSHTSKCWLLDRRAYTRGVPFFIGGCNDESK